MTLQDEQKKRLVALVVFWIGTIGDGLIAVEWFLISAGIINLPIIPGFFIGEGADYRYAMGVAAIFMLAWTILLYWGSLRPLERTGLFLITGVLIFLAIVLEVTSGLTIFKDRFTTQQMIWGVVVKGYLVVQFLFAYWYTNRKM